MPKKELVSNLGKNSGQSILKLIFQLAIPLILASFLQVAYQLIDAFWVGKLGQKAIAAVSLSYPLIFLTIALSVGFSMAGGILIAQYSGRGDRKGVLLSFNQSLMVSFLAGFLMMLIGLVFSKPVIAFLTKDKEVFQMAYQYVFFSLWGVPIIFIFNAVQSALRSVKEVRLPLLIILSTVILNFFLDPLLMFGKGFVPAWGVSGVALATLATEALSVVLALAIVFGKRELGLEIKKEYLIPQKEWIGKIFQLGIPSSLESSSRSIGMALMTFIIASLGTTIIASFGVVMRVFSFAIIPSVGFSSAVSVLVGQNLGANRFEEAEKVAKKGMQISFLILSIFSLLGFLFAYFWVSIFAPGEKEVIETGATFLKFLSFNFGIIGVQMIILGAFRAAGKASLAMKLTFFQVLVLVLTAVFLAFVLGLKEKGIWLSYLVANLISLGVNFSIFTQQKWQANLTQPKNS